MSILIFTEALAHTGLGHLGRCTALAERLTEEGNQEIKLLIHSDESFPDWKFPCKVIHGNWKNLSFFGKWIKKEITKPEIDIESTFYVDSYLATIEVYHLLKENCNQLVCIDDDYRLDYPAGSTILNPGYPGLFIKYNADKHKVITGKNQVLLRKPFREKFTVPRRNNPPQKVLLTLGGVDPNHYMEKFINILVGDFPKLEKHVVIGNGFTSEETLQQIKDDRTKYHKNLSAIEMRNIMLSVDFAITAGGQTTYELDRCGVPFVMIETAKNQKRNISSFVQLEDAQEIKEPQEIVKLFKAYNPAL